MKLDGLKILLVEDCPDQQRMLLHLLEQEGGLVYLECDGYAAVRMVRRAMRDGQPFDAVIMDLVLEASDGIDATRSIVQMCPSMPIVAITAHGSEKIEKQWRAAGCHEYLEKPLTAYNLIAAIGFARSKALEKQDADADITTTTVPMMSLQK
jgi:CheY-like chemotaxis protein